VRAPGRDGLLPWAGYAALLLGLLVLGVQVQRTMTAVLSLGSGAGSGTSGDMGEEAAGWGSIAARDSLIARAHVGARDPFQSGAPRVTSSPAAAESRPAPDPDPRLGSLLFDNVAPSVQLTVGPSRSGWLRQGDAFLGWKVVEVGRTSVKVAKGSRTLVLGSS
jgi:hypothetical protein